MKLSNMFNRAKQEVDKRGGVDALKEDASELRGIAKQKGSMGDKAKAAGQAIKIRERPARTSRRPAASPSSRRRVRVLLARHRDAQALLRTDQVVEILGGFVDVDLHPHDAAR